MLGTRFCATPEALWPDWGWTLLPAAVAVLALTLWVFASAAKGWPVVEA